MEQYPIDMKEALDDALQYQAFLSNVKEQILDPSDYQEMRDKKTKELINVFLKKSGYYKLKRVFKVEIELIEWDKSYSDKGILKTCIFHVKGKLPNGEEMDAFGACDSMERGKKGANDIIGTAHTRANLRAISQLVDFGSVSADEIARLDDKE